MVGGVPARLSSEKPAGSTTSAVAAVAVNAPAVPFAVKRGEVAAPEAFVVSVACAPPPSKLAPAAAAVDPAPPAPEPSAKVTLTPSTGLPLASSTVAWSGCA